MRKRVEFRLAAKAEPQGSAKAFVIGGRARITSDNAKLKPFRKQVGQAATVAIAEAGMALPAFDKHEPVLCLIAVTFERPASAPRKRTQPVVKPDLDKLARSILDSLTGIAWHDDAQVTALSAVKEYGDSPCVHVIVEEVTTC